MRRNVDVFQSAEVEAAYKAHNIVVTLDGNQVRMKRQAGSRNMCWKGVELVDTFVTHTISVCIKCIYNCMHIMIHYALT